MALEDRLWDHLGRVQGWESVYWGVLGIPLLGNKKGFLGLAFWFLVCVLWFSVPGLWIMVYGFMDLWVYSFVVLWFCGFRVSWFMALWFCSCMVYWFLGFKHLPSFHFMLSQKDWPHIQYSRDLIRRVVVLLIYFLSAAVFSKSGPNFQTDFHFRDP